MAKNILDVIEARGPQPHTPGGDHAVGGVVGGATVVASSAAVSISPHGSGVPKVRHAAPVHPSMTNNGGGHAVSRRHGTAQPLDNVQGSRPTKAVPVPPLHTGAPGRPMTSDPDYRHASYSPELGDAVIAETVGPRHLPGAEHHSHSRYAKK